MNPVVRAEGIAERLGDIVIACTGTPGAEIAGNLALTLNTTITNRLSSANGADVILTANNGSGPAQVAQPATLSGVNQVMWSGLRFTLGSRGTLELRISNIRGDASFGGAARNPSPNALPGQVVLALLAFNPGGLLNFTNTTFVIGTPQAGLLATAAERIVACQIGSSVPDEPTFERLVRAGTVYSSVRVTEGFFTAFEPLQPQSTQGTRILLRFSGLPAGARVLVPAALAGSNALLPTSGGDFNLQYVSGGSYVAGSNSLFLVRVVGTDQNGAGGYAAGGAVTTNESGMLNGMTEVTLVNGAGVAVYEVLDANPQVRETVEIPIFAGIPRTNENRNITIQARVSFAPLSNERLASTNAAVPRFTDVEPAVDCTVLGDCGVILPQLQAWPMALDFTLTERMGVQERSIPLGNTGGGRLHWSARVEYKNGADWITLTPTAGDDAMSVRMLVIAGNLAAGTYEATVVIDAGPAGVARYPVTLRVVPRPVTPEPPPQPATPKPVITSIVNGASFQTGPVAPGAFVTLKGSNLSGTDLKVTFDGKPARVTYTSNDQLNVVVPVDIGSNAARVVVSAAGVESAPVMVDVAAVSPAIFVPGILNQDGTINSATNPAPTGTTVQIFATGVLPAQGNAVVDAKLHDRTLQNLPYAGPTQYPGLQQVNVPVPLDLPTMQTEVLVCTAAGGQRVCSRPVAVHLRNAE